MKAYTNIEQSKKLAEILPLESADMSWVSNGLGKPFARTSDDELTWLKTFIEEEAYYLSMDIRDEIDRKKLINLQNALAWLEKQGEQPTDKVETKFKVGDWISGYYTNYKVTAIHSKGYMVEDTDGTKINIPFENEKFHHLWTIQDAKDGDVLASKDGYDILIFKNLDSNADFSSHYNIMGKRELGWANIKFIPATKEQRDLLFQKMKIVGYKWDTEKKELRKIESKTFNE